MLTRRTVLALALLALATNACSNDSDDDPQTTTSASATNATVLEGDLLVFGAASLTDAFTEMATIFEAANPGVDVQFNFASSSALRDQILEGAPADVFASASDSTMNAIAAEDLVVGDAVVFVRNELEIAVPAGNPGEVSGLADFSRPDLLIGLCAEGVPCGDFGREALTKAGVAPQIDTNEPDVRSLLTKIETDELDAGIVYVTDVLAAGDAVAGVEIPEDDNVIASYPIGWLRDSPNPAAAAAWVEFVLSPAGREILASYGFKSP